MKQVIVSFSGGRTSAYLCSLIKKSHPDAVFVFMDTGAEHPKTYRFIRECDDYFDLKFLVQNAPCIYGVLYFDNISRQTFKLWPMSLMSIIS